MDALATSYSAYGPQSAHQRLDLRAQAQQMEGVFLNTLVSEMFKGINARGDFGGGFGEETWRSMQSEQFANAIAQNGGIGLADDIMRSLMAVQENAGNLNPAANPNA
ncbi:MAG: rod-binding protein [Hyphomicrobiaceae bacterium]|nr:rod-binding protein [Hyphomicrobiaceae bacterium]